MSPHIFLAFTFTYQRWLLQKPTTPFWGRFFLPQKETFQETIFLALGKSMIGLFRESQRAGELVYPGASLGQWRVRFWSVNILASAWLSWDNCGSRLQESPFGAYWVWDANYTSQWSHLVITDYSSGWSLGWRYKFIRSKWYFNFGLRSKIGREDSPGIFKTSKEKGRLEKKSEKSHPMK